MRKGILVLLLVLFLVPTSFATYTKLNTMGHYSEYYMVDDYNILLWPQLLTDYPNLLIYQHPKAGGITWKIGANDVLGFEINDFYYEIPGWSDYYSEVYYAYYPYDKFTLGYAHKFETFKMGLGFDWAGNSYKTENGGVTYEEKINMMGFRGGFSIDIGEGHSLDLSAAYQGTSFKVDKDGADYIKSNGGTMIDLLGRFNYQYNEKTRLVPVFEFTNGKVGFKGYYNEEGVYPDTTDYSTSIVHFGIGCNHKPNDKVELINALGVIVEKHTEEDKIGDVKYTNTYTTMPYFLLGADVNVKSWLNLRFGLNKWLGSKKFETAGIGTSSVKTDFANLEGGNFDYHVGVGIKVSGLEFDCLLRNSYFFDGPYFLSGENSGNMFHAISIKYQF